MTFQRNLATLIWPRRLPAKCFYAYCEAETQIWVVIPVTIVMKERSDGTTVPDQTLRHPGPVPTVFQVGDEYLDVFSYRYEHDEKVRRDFAYRFHADYAEAERDVQNGQLRRFQRWCK